ncbi:uncharacterized protein LOC111292784 [Durio zibethinus]|uniref:Uncharacterized protein LOC111292784 n=1 Tax=Durio zibethinus TaxID=66656 RepID=A0A6P5YKQ9_DURZI|nr:uncharacterized protein LOC111292784 [Durio zibethinus]
MSATRLMIYYSSKFGFSDGTSQGFESYLKPRCNYQPRSIIKHGLLPLSIGHSKTQTKINTKNKIRIFCINSVESGASSSPGASSNSWKSWILGILLSAVLSFWKHKWGPLLAMKEKVDRVVETAELVVEVVEKVAEEVEKVADEVADTLPKNGKLKEAVSFIETIAKETAKDARLAEELIQKVEDVEKEVIESLIEPVKGQVDKVVEDHDNKAK